MPSLKTIRKRISSVKSTQKITRAMKMVAAARLRRAQQRITELRPYAQKTADVLRNLALRTANAGEVLHPLLEQREEQRVLFVVITSDRGLAGAFNSSINRAAERAQREFEAEGKAVSFATIGRKGRDFIKRRDADVLLEFPAANEKVDVNRTDEIAAQIVDLFTSETIPKPTLNDDNELFEASSEEKDNEHDGEEPHHDAHEESQVEHHAGEHDHDHDSEDSEPKFDAVYLIYNEFKSAMTQKVVFEKLLPVQPTELPSSDNSLSLDFLYEPNQKALLDTLLPLYIQVSLYRALLESVASEHGARMTAMDAATNNAKDMIGRLTLDYNRARQAAITKELMEIIGGAEALK